MNKPPVDIRELQVDEVQLLTEELGEKPYRGTQLWEWLWKKRARSWDDMSDLPKAFRAKLAERCVLRPLVLAEEQKSEDGTVKCAFRTWDGHIVEGVLIPTPTRLTACISSQIGCSLTCSFCANTHVHALDQGYRTNGLT
jgi:23S rRNA (adenine2503-C2)-methyltransferase